MKGFFTGLFVAACALQYSIAIFGSFGQLGSEGTQLMNSNLGNLLNPALIFGKLPILSELFLGSKKDKSQIQFTAAVRALDDNKFLPRLIGSSLEDLQNSKILEGIFPALLSSKYGEKITKALWNGFKDEITSAYIWSMWHGLNDAVGLNGTPMHDVINRSANKVKTIKDIQYNSDNLLNIISAIKRFRLSKDNVSQILSTPLLMNVDLGNFNEILKSENLKGKNAGDVIKEITNPNVQSLEELLQLLST